MAPQLTSTNGRVRRWLAWWIARAISDLPVPVSPWISTVAFESATASIRSKTRCIWWVRPMTASTL
jgi:hypothetical protein